jgi:hypothetical protein
MLRGWMRLRGLDRSPPSQRGVRLLVDPDFMEKVGDLRG